MNDATPRLRRIGFFGLLLIALALPNWHGARAEKVEPKVFASAQDAAEALYEAAKTKDRPAMLAILGPETKKWIVSGDPVQDKQGLERFIAAFEQKHEIEGESGDKAVLAVGDDGFPFPFPIVKTASGWAFDPEQGKEELLNRRIGRNELSTILVLLAIGDAQRDYASADRDGDGLLEYAARFRSSDGKQDGLYWPTAEGEPSSPLGPLVADAVRAGYSAKKDGSDSTETQAYHGYHFKLLTRQGPDAPGGAYDYGVDGKLIGGFAVLAYPARYGLSGIMTLKVNHDGTVFESDLGPETDAAVQSLEAFNPGSGWAKVEPEQ